ncbi:MAG UNVERIFIED_CONTAM: hypothetical protein LVR18_50815 [Planctomycetaceae bacterium]
MVVSGAARQVFQQELGLHLPDTAGDCPQWLELARQMTTGPAGDLQFRPLQPLPGIIPGTVRQYGLGDFHSPLASGSSLTAGMAICPCSMGTLAAIASGQSQNLISIGPPTCISRNVDRCSWYLAKLHSG